MDVDFSLLEIPEATQLNFESSKHKRTLSKKGSFAHRKSPTRATTRPRSQEISFLDSTGDEPTSNQIDRNEVRTEEPDNKSQLENSFQEKPGDSRRVPGLVEGVRASQIPYTEKRTIPKARITTSPASNPSTSSVSSQTTTSAATLDTSPADYQNPDLVFPKLVPDISQKSAITDYEEGIRASSLSTRRTRRSERSKFLEDSEARSQLPSSKVMPQSSSLRSALVTDPTTLPFPASTLMPHLEYSQDMPENETSQSVEVQKRLPDSEILPGTETRHFEVTNKSYPTKFINNPKSTPQNNDSTKDNPIFTSQNPDYTKDNPKFIPRKPDSSDNNPESTRDNPKSTPDSRSKTPPVFKLTEYTRQNTNRENMSIGTISIVPTAAPELKYCTADNTNVSSNSSSKIGSKYWSNPAFDVSEASGKNSAGLNSKMAAVDISNRTDQKRIVDSTADSQKSFSFGEIRVIPEYGGGNYRHKGQHEHSQVTENKRKDSGNVLKVTGFSESERADPKQFVDSSSSVEIYRQNPCVIPTFGEVTIVCNLDHSLEGITSAVVVRDNPTDSVGSVTESCLTTGSLQLQSTGLRTGVAITTPPADHTPGLTSESSLTSSTGRTLRENDVTQQRSSKVGMYTSSFCMQLRGGFKPGGKDLVRVGVDTRILPERTFRFSFTPKSDSNTSLNIVSETAGGQT